MNFLKAFKLLPLVITWLGVYSHPPAQLHPNEPSFLRERITNPQQDSLATTSSLLQRRAIPNAPDGYTPLGEACPKDRPSIRNGSTLSKDETVWLEERRKVTVDAMMQFLGRLDFGSFNGSSYIEKNTANTSRLPNIGLAVSGGGYRALMNGGGTLQAFDSRTLNSSLPGHLGGVLQSATYLTGLSGGSWLVGSMYLNNFTDVTSLRDSANVWLFQDSIFVGPTQSEDFAVRTSQYFSQIQDAVTGKASAGYNSSITDYWCDRARCYV
jgi:lysophospholipase